jgi:hypothetical protein
MAFTIPGLLGMNNQQPDPYQSLLGGYYTPQQAKMAWLGGSLQGLGAGLASGKSGAWAQGLALGGGEGLDNYRQRAVAASALDMRKQDQEWQQKANARQEAEWASEDAQSQQMGALINSIQDPQERAYAQLNPEAYVKAKLAPPGGESGGYYGVPLPYQNEDGSFGYGLPSKSGQFSPLQAPQGGQFLSPFQTAQQKAAGSASGTQSGGAASAIPGAQLDANAINAKIDAIIANPDLPNAIGYGNAIGDYFVGNNVLNIRSQLNELEGSAFMSAYTSLRGGGQITEVESAQAKQAMADMQTARKMSDVDGFKAALERFRGAVNLGVQKLQAQAGQYAPQGGTPAPAGNGGYTVEEVP